MLSKYDLVGNISKGTIHIIHISSLLEDTPLLARDALRLVVEAWTVLNATVRPLN